MVGGYCGGKRWKNDFALQVIKRRKGDEVMKEVKER